MSFELVLNELSLEHPAPDIAEARQRMSRFIKTFVVATGTYKLNRALRVKDEHLNYIELAPGYLLAQWRNDQYVSLEEREFFRVLQTMQPYLVEHADREEVAVVMECRWNGNLADGLQAALLLDSLAISVPSDRAWDTSRVEVLVRELDTEGEWLPDRSEPVYHVAKAGHLRELAAWIEQRLQAEVDRKRQAIQTGTELWSQCNTLYPSLEFCTVVQKQLQDYPLQQDHIKAIGLRLLYLEQYSQHWRELGGRFDKDQLSGNASLESQQTLHHPEYGPKRVFQCLDGRQRVFSWHLKIYGLNWRLHFYPDEQRQTIIVGYIGPHLPTVRFNT